MILRTAWGAATFVILTGPAVSSAQQQSLNGVSRPGPAVAVAARAVPGSPSIDGRLDDAVWQLATPITDFTQRDPDEGQPGTERTEVRILYTDAAIYFGVRAYDSEPDRIAGQLTRRDDSSPSDWIQVGIDSYHDRRSAFVFAVNPAGVKRDIYYFNDTDSDRSWDAVWDVAVTRDSEGWSAEFRIPFSQLRFSASDEHRFGFQVVRSINRKNEEQHWRLMPKTESGIVSQFGDLVGLDGVQPPRRLEVQPYMVARQDVKPGESGNPFVSGHERAGSLGADIVYGLTSNLTLTATINPDFGQVEADPAVVNLSAFESFFPERRPFFNEGIDIFQFNLGGGDGNSEGLFYTRRIGRRPQGEADPRGGYADQIQNTTILGAAKLSGKTQRGWTVGLLGAVTAKEEAGVIDQGGAPFTDVVEPRSYYTVGRVQREMRGGQTVVGLFGTATVRNLPEGGDLDFLRSSAFAIGTNLEHRFRHNTYAISGWASASHIAGSEAAIELAQRSSARYYQRPDNDYVTLDPTRTSLNGLAGSLAFDKQGGGTWRFSTGVSTRSPGYEVNDLGFQRSADFTSQYVWVQRRWVQPGTLFRRFFINLNQWSSYNYGWDRTELGGNLNMNFTLLNYWGGSLGANVNAATFATDALRGGPGFTRPPGWNGWAELNSDGRKNVQLGVGGWYFRQQAAETKSGGFWTDVTVRPAGNMDFTFSPNVNWTRDDWQFLGSAEVLNTDRYLFGDLSQTTVATQFRGNLTFTPTLSLQLYAEPFVSAGRYLEYKQVADPLADRYEDRFDVFGSDRLIVEKGDVSVDFDRDGSADVGLGNPNFRFLSFRSNAVIRWEYRSGSSLFVVWQHGRSGFNNNGRFDFTRGVGDLFRQPGENTFVVKLNYWFSL
ncbi:MAG TPA: DUF5916 domain-containing protein [Gemmatimonadales bacterium]